MQSQRVFSNLTAIQWHLPYICTVVSKCQDRKQAKEVTRHWWNLMTTVLARDNDFGARLKQTWSNQTPVTYLTHSRRKWRSLSSHPRHSCSTFYSKSSKHTQLMFLIAEKHNEGAGAPSVCQTCEQINHQALMCEGSRQREEKNRQLQPTIEWSRDGILVGQSRSTTSCV